MLLFRILPYVPTSLPTLLFCRITELTITLEGENLLTHALWEEMVRERAQLMDVSNDIKMIGNPFLKSLATVLNLPWFCQASFDDFLLRNCVRSIWRAGDTEYPPFPFPVARHKRRFLKLWSQLSDLCCLCHEYLLFHNGLHHFEVSQPKQKEPA